MFFSEFSNGLSNAFKLENGVMMSTKRRSLLIMANFCLLLLHKTFAHEDSSTTFAKIFDSSAILSSRNDPPGKARLLTIHPLE